MCVCVANLTYVLQGIDVAPFEPQAFSVKSDRSKEVWYIKAATEEEYQQWKDAVENGMPSVSDVKTVKHVTHVAMDQDKGFTGLPSEWEKLLRANDIALPANLNTSQVSAVMKVHDALVEGRDVEPEGRERAGVASVASAVSTSLPRASEARDALPTEFSFTLRDLVNPADPASLYTDMEMLDEGSMGKVYLATSVASQEKVAIKTVKLSGETLSHMIVEIAILK